MTVDKYLSKILGTIINKNRRIILAMKETNEKKSAGYSSPYEFEGRIPLSQAIPLGLQHVMAMFIGNLTPLIIVMGVCGLTADAGFSELRTALLQNAMIIAGITSKVSIDPLTVIFTEISQSIFICNGNLSD